MDEVDEYNAARADYGHTGEYHQGHGPSNTYRDGCSAGEHGKEVEHTSDFLSGCPLICECIGIELWGKFELILLIEPSYILSQ